MSRTTHITLNDSGKPRSAEEYEIMTPKPEENIEHPVEVPLVPDPIFVPETPQTPGDHENTDYSNFDTAHETLLDQNTTMTTLRDSEIDDTITSQKLDFNPQVASSPKMAVERHTRKSTRQTVTEKNPGFYKKML